MAIYRIVYLEFVGEIGDLYVLHRCDDPDCCNPSHLFLGTQKDNVQDARNKGRLNNPRPVIRGENNHASKLTEDAAKEVKRTPVSAANAKLLADKYGVSTTAIRRIWIGKSWRHVPWEE